MRESQLEELRKAREMAEAAVADMADDGLKRSAFEVLFAHLLRMVSSEPIAVRSKESDTSSESRPSRAPQSPTERLLALREEDFFTEPRSLGEVQSELRNHGWHYAVERLGTPLLRLVQQKQLRRERLTDGGKKLWKYVNL